MTALKVVVIGFGNVGQNIAAALISAGHNLVQIVSTSKASAPTFTGIHYVSNLMELDLSADIYLVTKSDRFVMEVSLPKLSDGQIIAHCSGSLPNFSNRPGHAVFYPFQTFSVGVSASFDQIPIGIESNSDEDYSRLESMAKSLGANPFHISQDQRSALHIAGVVSCNFVNHLLTLTEDWLRQHQLDGNLVAPLVHETIKKAFEKGPFASQTGPAVRRDEVVLEMHRKALIHQSPLKEIYDQITQSIIDRHHDDEKGNR